MNDALAHRPELAESRINLSNTAISNKAIRSALLPSLDLFAYYSGTGLGGALNASYACLQQNIPVARNALDTAPQLHRIPATLNQLINSTAPDKGVGIAG